MKIVIYEQVLLFLKTDPLDTCTQIYCLLIYNINITLIDNFSHGQVPYRTSAVYRFRDISI